MSKVEAISLEDEFGGLGTGLDPVKKPEIVYGSTPDGKDVTGPVGCSFNVGVCEDIQADEQESPLVIEVPPLRKRARKPMNKRQKILRVMLRRGGCETIPPLSKLLSGKTGMKVEIRMIGLFPAVPKDPLLAVVAKECPIRSLVNQSADISLSRIVTVGSSILKAGRMYLPIHVARIKETGALDCISGRYRLAFLALMYGGTTEVPVYMEDLTMDEARNAAAVANQSRPEKAMERAEHAILQVVGGNEDTEQDRLYSEIVTTKLSSRKYCLFSVLKRNYPARLTFTTSSTVSKRDGGLTTITSVESFWGTALDWSKGMPREEFDAGLKDSVLFLNALMGEFLKISEFEPDEHASVLAMMAIGKYYKEYRVLTGRSAIEVSQDIAKKIVKMGKISKQKWDKIYTGLAGAMSE